MNSQTPQSGITFLKTHDLNATTQFYTQVMNFELVLDQGTCRIFKVCSNCFLGFCLTDGDTGSQEVIFTIEVEDVDGFCEKLDARGVEIETRPRLNQRFNIYQMFLQDPNGYLLEIQHFLDPQWSQAKV